MNTPELMVVPIEAFLSACERKCAVLLEENARLRASLSDALVLLRRCAGPAEALVIDQLERSL